MSYIEPFNKLKNQANFKNIIRHNYGIFNRKTSTAAKAKNIIWRKLWALEDQKPDNTDANFRSEVGLSFAIAILSSK